MSRYLIELMERDIPKMTVREWLDWVERSRPLIDVSWRSEDVLREARQEESPDE